MVHDLLFLIALILPLYLGVVRQLEPSPRRAGDFGVGLPVKIPKPPQDGWRQRPLLAPP